MWGNAPGSSTMRMSSAESATQRIALLALSVANFLQFLGRCPQARHEKASLALTKQKKLNPNETIPASHVGMPLRLDAIVSESCLSRLNAFAWQKSKVPLLVTSSAFPLPPCTKPS